MQSVESGSAWRGQQGRVLWFDLTVALGLCLSLCSQLPVGVSGHGYLVDPPQRPSAWRRGFNTPVNQNDNASYCGGLTRHWTQNGGKCGVCGDPFDLAVPRPNELGGTYGRSIIVATYTAGQVIDTNITITTQHGGWFEYRLCTTGDSTNAPLTQACLDANLLEVVSGSTTTKRLVVAQNSGTGSFVYKVKLPEGVACPRCVLQWKWRNGDLQGIGPDGKQCKGCGNQVEFYNCADISIVAIATTTLSTASLNVTPSTVYVTVCSLVVSCLSLLKLL